MYSHVHQSHITTFLNPSVILFKVVDLNKNILLNPTATSVSIHFVYKVIMYITGRSDNKSKAKEFQIVIVLMIVLCFQMPLLYRTRHSKMLSEWNITFYCYCHTKMC